MPFRRNAVSTVDNTTNPQPRGARQRIGLGVILLILAVCGWGAWFQWWRPDVRAEQLLNQARRNHARGREQQAEQNAVDALALDPSLYEAALLAADCAVSQKKYQHALDYLKRLQTSESDALVRAALVSAELQHYHLDHLSDAEQSYRIVLKFDPEHIEANSGLATLLGLCGRRREAIPHALQLIRQGEETDLLMLLARESGVVNDPEALERARTTVPDDANPLLGLAWHAADNEQTDRAIQLLRDALKRQPDLIAAHVALGQQLLAANQYDELVDWEKRITSVAEHFPELWLVRAQVAEKYGIKKEAIRCYWEAARRAPESKFSNFRLAHLLSETGDVETAERFSEHIRRLQELGTVQDRVLFSSGHETIEPAIDLARSYEKTGRFWEAYAWCQLAARIDRSHQGAQRYLRKLQNKVEGIPLQLTDDSANIALTIDFSSYPLPSMKKRDAAFVAETPKKLPPISFRNDAVPAGLRFHYFNGTSGPPSRRMFEFTGGGIGVLDFDLDGFPDICFTQGRPWPPDTRVDEYSDRIFQNRGGTHFEDVTVSAGIRESGFGQGIAIGDFNSDGFPDLYVANIGVNRLWMNNGDGTFTDVTIEANGGGKEWTTSCVLADLNGDGLPDIYDVNYLTSNDIFERFCKHPDGTPRACLPFHFGGETDRLWLNDGNGGFTDATMDILSVEPSGKGLGVAVWDTHGTGRLSLLVANDTSPNFFFVPESTDDHRLYLIERGIAAGLALNGEGKAEGCMGIGLGDIDDDGQLDVHITNFLSESNTLYMNSSIGFYEDRTRMLDLHTPTIDVLGFGTQFLDVDLDGRLELFVTNGHVDDLRQHGRPYKMPPQLFKWNNQRFLKVDETSLGSYFQKQWLGRSVATIDWNRDGRSDLLVGHLDNDSALLTNTTSQVGRFLSLRLFGVESNRDAIGTTIRVRVNHRTITRQLTAGSGYQASNERRLIVGVGDAQQIDELVVRWPSGKVQKFENVPVSQEVWLPEGEKLFLNTALNGDQ